MTTLPPIHTLVLAPTRTAWQDWLSSLPHERRRALRPYLAIDSLALVGKRPTYLLVLDLPPWWTKADSRNLVQLMQSGTIAISKEEALHGLDTTPVS